MVAQLITVTRLNQLQAKGECRIVRDNVRGC
jgi:hypothetical protein